MRTPTQITTISILLCLFLTVAFWGAQAKTLASPADTQPLVQVQDALVFYQNESAKVPILLQTGGQQISALVFALVFDPARLSLDKASDVVFSLPNGVSGSATFAEGRTDTLNVIIFSIGNVTIPSSTILTIPFSPICQNAGSSHSTTVGFGESPPLSFGGPDGAQIAGTSVGARVSLICRDAPNTPTPTATATDIPGTTRTPTATPTGGPSGTAGDADGDGVTDLAECPGGIPCPDLDKDGVSDVYESNIDDFDGDGIPDYRDEDDDGDSIPTAAENPDPNGDGIPLDAQDTDGDKRPDYLDVDDDNDGVYTINEVIRGRVSDAGRDTDADGIPDYLDTDDDGDTVPTIWEKPNANGSGQDTDGDGTPDYLDSDDDNDRIATRREDINGDGNPRNDDTDDDGIPNYLDADDDNDGVPTVREDPDNNNSPLNDDTDGDGIPNYLDPDDDNDGVPTFIEGEYDEDGDGIPDYLDPDTLGKRRVWLALVGRNSGGTSGTAQTFPDLVVESLQATGAGVLVVIRNQGQAPVTSGFWVDVYINPNSPPTAVNQRWNDIGTLGMAWGVGGEALPLAPGAALTLISFGQHYSSERSNFAGVVPVSAQLWAQADAYRVDSIYGNVEEVDEQGGGVYNNITGPVTTP